jgi:dihydropteroate synthase
MTLKQPIILGVLNVSPESSNKDSVSLNRKSILRRAMFLKKHGADYIDIGARSTSNKKKKISEKVEFKRLIPAIKILKEKGYKVSVDTWSTSTAIRCLENKVDMINFTSGTFNKKLFESLRKYDAWLIMTYMPYKDVYNMERYKLVDYKIKKILDYFEFRIKMAKQYKFKKIIIDPNVGIFHQNMGKIEKMNLKVYVLNNLTKLRKFGFPLLVSLSYRKHHGLVIIMMALTILQNKVEFIRTHDPDVITKLLEGQNG